MTVQVGSFSRGMFIDLEESFFLSFFLSFISLSLSLAQFWGPEIVALIYPYDQNGSARVAEGGL